MKDREYLILAIDTSCDETSVAVTLGHTVLSNVVASQVELHRPYGGIFPTVAKLAHQEHLAPALALALKRARVTAEELDAVAVTIGPGLAPALEVGIKFSQAFAKLHNKPLIPANHLEGHICSVLAKPAIKSHTTKPTISTRTTGLFNDQAYADNSKLSFDAPTSTDTPEPTANKSEPKLPSLAIVVSGGNTLFVKVEARVEIVDTTREPSTQSRQINAQRKQSMNEETLNSQSQPSSQENQQQLQTNTSLERQPRLALDTPAEQTPWQPAFAYTVLGRTLDDAAGECLDKVGRMLNLGYPAGPVVEEFAKLGDRTRYQFPLPLTQTNTFDLSYSGIKTHSRNLLTSLGGVEKLHKQDIFDFCASLQHAVFRHLTYKLEKVLLHNLWREKQYQEVWLSGGVAANTTLRKAIRKTLRNHATKHHLKTLRLGTPYTKALCGDNAAMVGVAADQHSQVV